MHTHTQTDRHTTTAYTALSIASHGKNDHPDQNQITVKSYNPLDRLTAHRSDLANLIITYIDLYRAQYSIHS